MSEAGFWITTTFIAGFIAVLAIVILVAILFFAKKEGRYMIKRGTFAKGIDLLLVNPQSNKLELKVIEWAGNIWKEGKEGMMVGMSLMGDPKNVGDRLYNDLIRNTSTWAGSSRPVVMATPMMSTLLNPAFIAAANKGEAIEDKTGLIKKYVELCKEHELETITYLEVIKPAELKKYLKDIGPKNMRDSFLKGVEAQKLSSTKPPKEKGALGGMWLWLVIMAVGLIAVFYLLQSGALDGIL